MEPESDPDYECKSGRDNFRNADFAPLSQSQKVNKSSCGRLPSSPKKAKLKTRRMLSERLLAPTHTSRAKMSALDKKEQKHKCKSGPISERAVLHTCKILISKAYNSSESICHQGARINSYASGMSCFLRMIDTFELICDIDTGTAQKLSQVSQ